jgi:hypothetical protein
MSTRQKRLSLLFALLSALLLPIGCNAAKDFPLFGVVSLATAVAAIGALVPSRLPSVRKSELGPITADSTDAEVIEHIEANIFDRDLWEKGECSLASRI